MATYAITPQVSARLNASGAGQCSLTPPSGTRWDLSLAAVSVASATGAALAGASRCFLYLGNSNGPLTLIDSTFLGNNASSAKVAGAPFFHGTYLWAVWAGADANAIATLQVYGNQFTKYRAGPR